MESNVEVKDGKTELVEVKKQEVVDARSNAPLDSLMMMLGNGINPEQIDKFLEVQERWERNEAKKQYARDFASAQSEIEAVSKSSSNPQTHSKYAKLDHIISSAKPVYTKHGFAVIFYEQDSPLPDCIRICADVLHKAGHKETYHYDVPLDGKGIKGNSNMTNIHAKASSTSYGRRYLMCMVWNIPTQDDDDGNGGMQSDSITTEHLKAIRDFLSSIGETNEEPISKFMNVERIEDIKDKDFPKVLSLLNARKVHKQSKEEVKK